MTAILENPDFYTYQSLEFGEMEFEELYSHFGTSVSLTCSNKTSLSKKEAKNCYDERSSVDDEEFMSLVGTASNCCNAKLELTYNINRSELIRALIVREAFKISQSGRTEARSLRNLWYIIKPVLMRAEQIGSEDNKWGRTASQRLSAILSEMVLGGELRYSDLAIEDDSRNLDTTSRYENSAFSKLIIFIEKDSIYRVIQPVASFYNASVISGSGFGATASIEKILKKLDQSEDQDYLILALTDFDSYGFQIYEDFHNRATTLGLRANIQRVGIDPTDLTPQELQYQKYPISITSSKDQQWATTYGIGGVTTDSKGKQISYGLELDAITEPDRMRKLLVEAIKKYANYEQDYFDELRSDTKEEAKDPSINEIIAKLLENDPRTEVLQELSNLVYQLEELKEKVEEQLDEQVRPIIDELSEDEEFDTREDPDENSLHAQAEKVAGSYYGSFRNRKLTRSAMQELFVPEGLKKFEDQYEKPEIDENLDFRISEFKDQISEFQKFLEDLE